MMDAHNRKLRKKLMAAQIAVAEDVCNDYLVFLRSLLTYRPLARLVTLIPLRVVLPKKRMKSLPPASLQEMRNVGEPLLKLS